MGLRLLVCSLFVVSGLSSVTQAALVSITSVDAVGTSAYNLTTLGVNDWAYWNQTANPVSPLPAAPTNRKNIAPSSFIGNISAFGTGGGSVRGTTGGGPAAYTFSFTDGTTPVNSSVSDLRGLFNTLIGSAGVNNGIQLTVTAPSANPFNIYVWGTAFQATANLTADVLLGTPATATDSTQIGDGDRLPGKVYTILVTPDFAGQQVNLRYVLSAPTDAGNANISLSGVAIGPATVIPEPSTLALLFGGSSFLGWRILRRRVNAAN
jgi:hypothetical protein